MIIAIDFDGVLHSYIEKWQGTDIIPDPPVDGALDWLLKLLRDPILVPTIYSSRSKYPEGIAAMRAWLMEHYSNKYGMDIASDIVESIRFASEKPAAFLTIDDRAVQFRGIFPTPEAIKAFTPWTKDRDAPEPLSTVISLLKEVQKSHTSADKTQILSYGATCLDEALKMLEGLLV